ncbi:MAG: nicotinate (nicotinamide) nucleotide adenylyltransferase [Erysipelotrichaceae bacterium]
MRIAILGGSFDPIHDGHLAMAKYAKKHLPIDIVVFSLAKDNPIKNRALSGYRNRLDMLKIAIRPYKYMYASTIENYFEGSTYTINTVKLLMKRYPQHQFIYLIGNDQSKQLDKWKDIEELVKLIPFYVFKRNEETIECKYDVHKMNMPLVNISSTMVRSGCNYQISKGVQSYINNNYLYLEERIANMMSKERFEHSRRVAKLCVDIAKQHNVDIKDAYLAGILHDICKEMKPKELKIWMTQLYKDKLEENESIWHGYVGSYMCQRMFGVNSKQIRSAIFHHVKGESKNKLAMILYMSDKLDPGRDYDSSATIALAKKDLEAAYEEVQKQQHSHLKKEGIING